MGKLSEQELIDQRVLGHGEGQEHAIADVNAGRVDDLIQPRLKPLLDEVARLTAERDVAQEDARRTSFQSTSAFLERCRATHRENLLSRVGPVEPGSYQARWRVGGGPPFSQTAPAYDPSLAELAIVDALIEQGSIAAWSGDGVGCVAQMIQAQAERASKAEAEVARLTARGQQLEQKLSGLATDFAALWAETIEDEVGGGDYYRADAVDAIKAKLQAALPPPPDLKS